MIDFDDMLIQVGEFGIYQKALFVFQAPFCMFVTFILFGQLFMTLNPRTIWCQDHFNCTHSNMTPAQRQNLTFAYTMGVFNPCYIQNFDFENGVPPRGLNLWDIAWVKAIVDMVNGPLQGRNFSEANETTGLRRQEFNRNLNCARSQFNLLGRGQQFQCPNQEFTNRNSRGYGSSYGGQQYAQGPATRTPGAAPWNTDQYSGATRYPQTDTRSGYGGSRYPGSPSGGPYGSASGSSGNNRQDNTPGWGTNTDDPKFGSGGSSWGTQSGQSPGAASVDEQSRKICGNLNISMNLRNTSFIFLLERNETSPRRDDRFLPVTACNNVTWDRFSNTTDVPYPTIVTDGGWWCNAETYNTISTALFFVGAIVGGFLIGWIADSFGRVPALVVANLLGAIGGALSVSTTNFYAFSFFRFITGMAFDNCFTMMYILVLEFCGPTYRTLVANLSIAVFYTLGTILLPLLAQLIGNWQIYGLVISLPMLLGVFAIFLVPESARWLLSKGRTAEATNILRSFAKVNGKQVNESVFASFEQDAQALFDSMKESEEKEETFFAALRTPRLRKTFILLTMIWSLIALVYDGHSRNILNLSNENWSVFYMFMIASMTEFPADIMLIFTLDRFGRRWLSFGALTLSGAASIIAAAVPENSFTATLVLAMVARFFVNVAFNIGLQYAAELLPTVIRAQGVNAIHIMGYVASIISPFIAMIGRTNRALSLILLGGFSIAGGFLSLFLAETLGEDLPNTLEEAENFGKDQSFWNCPICAPPREEYERPPEPISSEEDTVVRRNKWRSSNTGAIYRSSMISHSRSSRGSGRHAHQAVALEPLGATETTQLRRITH